jgi:hypothetical protein
MNADTEIPHRTVRPEVLKALDPLYRTAAELLIQRGTWSLETEQVRP